MLAIYYLLFAIYYLLFTICCKIHYLAVAVKSILLSKIMRTHFVVKVNKPRLPKCLPSFLTFYATYTYKWEEKKGI